MNKFWSIIFKPKGVLAKILVIASLMGTIYFWTNGHFSYVKEYLDTESFTFEAGNFKITLYSAIRAILMVVMIFWITSMVSEFVDNRISKMKKMSPADKALTQKIFQIIIYVISFLVALNIIGLDLTSLTVLSGAIGIGLGFGLQKIASNFVSGIILLLERSIKPGDLLELEDGTFGYVRKSSSRATLIETIDGKEIIVPNEEFIIKQVVNWTLNNSKARVTVNIGVSYACDIENARNLILEAVNEHKRTYNDPEASCFLDEFGDSSVNFIVYFWVEDVNQGFRNIKSEIMFDIWNKFKAHDIEIPFPQRDLHIKSSDIIKAENK